MANCQWIFCCRTLDGKFDEQKFAKQSQLPQIKMIELKLSQGAKPGHGGILPKHKITAEIAEIRGVSVTMIVSLLRSIQAFDTN